MKKKITKVLNIVVTVLVIFVLVISILILTVTLTSKNGTGVPNVFGKAPIAVLTDSMKGDGELNFNEGDLIFCETIEDPVSTNHEIGEVVTFIFDINGDQVDEYVTHRIYKVNKDGTYLTKGDNNETYDQNPKNKVVFPAIVNADILARYNGAKISGLGNILRVLQTQEGFFFAILLPMIIFFLYEGVRVIVNIVAYSKEKAIMQAREAIQSADLTEEQKQRAIEEYLAAQGMKPKEESDADNPPKQDGSDSSDEVSTEQTEESVPDDEEKNSAM